MRQTFEHKCCPLSTFALYGGPRYLLARVNHSKYCARPKSCLILVNDANLSTRWKMRVKPGPGVLGNYLCARRIVVHPYEVSNLKLGRKAVFQPFCCLTVMLFLHGTWPRCSEEAVKVVLTFCLHDNRTTMTCSTWNVSHACL